MTQEVIVVTSIAHGGAGVGRPKAGEGESSGPTWFVTGALPGEEVTAEVEHRAKRFVRGRLTEIQTAASARVEPPCPLAQTCGGCAWQHVAVAEQAGLKRRIVADQLRGVVPDTMVTVFDREIAGDAGALGYRRRARVHYERDDDGTVRLGFFAQGSRALVDVPSCPVLAAPLNRALSQLREHPGLLRTEGEVHL
ncbi:MAG: TRAM domain-containing protein, partial [Myxococcota bacterium]